MDVGDADAIDRLGAALAERWGRLDMLVGNAGLLGSLTPTAHIDPDEFEKTMAVNVTANARLIRAMEPLLMQAETPRAVFVTSGAASKALPYWGTYAVSKAALNALVQTWANEHANDKLRANLLSPGPVRTAMRAQAMPGEDPQTLPEPADIAPLFLQMLDAGFDQTGEIMRYQG
jgi:NAD(P)-dependent dehydrogenase (short-subunit alcohol dehydrogenase family)